MVAFSKVLATAAFTASTFASPLKVTDSLVLFHELKDLPAHWVSKGRVTENVQVKAQIGLKQGNIQALQAKLLDISNPDSANYGKWLSKDEVARYTAPPANTVSAVKAWLAAHGITETSQPTNDWIEFSAPVSTMEKLLGAEYEWFSHSGRAAIPRTMKYSIPEHLHAVVDMVTPTTAFYAPQTPGISESHSSQSQGIASPAASNTCSNGVTPDCLKKNYNVDYNSTGSVTVASTLMLGLGANHNDYAQFARTYVPGLKDFKDISVQGGTNTRSTNQDTILEGNLDTQWVGGVSYPNPNQLLILGPNGNSDQNFQDEVSGLASYLTSNAAPPSSVSTSYGGPESAYDSSYMQRVCNEFMKAGSMGISVFFSSGDYGVADNRNQCNNGYIVQWPASCPWTTAVGGTQFSGNTEVVANYNPTLTSPGGGYSRVFTAPDYNSAVTKAYLTNNGGYAGKQNANNRGLPDVALQSIQYNTIVNGQDLFVRGTSCSAPAWAGLVGLLNDYRKKNGKPNLGFINPLLYKNPQVMNDITSGNNNGCGQPGYKAATGWDPTTGLGSVNFAALRALV